MYSEKISHCVFRKSGQVARIYLNFPIKKSIERAWHFSCENLWIRQQTVCFYSPASSFFFSFLLKNEKIGSFGNFADFSNAFNHDSHGYIERNTAYTRDGQTTARRMLFWPAKNLDQAKTLPLFSFSNRLIPYKLFINM